MRSEGAKVVVADLNLTRRRRWRTRSPASAGEAIAVQIDVRDQTQAQAVVDAAVQQFGGLDILVNNAGVAGSSPSSRPTNEDWDLIFDVNCKGLLWCSQAAAAADDRAGPRRQDHQSRLAGGAPRRSAGAGLLRQQGVRDQHDPVDGAGAGPAQDQCQRDRAGDRRHPLLDRIDQQFAELLGWEVGEPKRTFVESIPLGRIEQPEDVAGVAIFLASSDCRLHHPADPQRRRRQLAGLGVLAARS